MTDQIHYIGRNHFKVMTTNAPNHVTFCSVASPNAGYTHSPHCNAYLKVYGITHRASELSAVFAGCALFMCKLRNATKAHRWRLYAQRLNRPSPLRFFGWTKRFYS